ncbi:DUF983 domain-containing protein [Sphingobium phenoxybenzoativorans]|uniref:DUF983 domain-containing protein n=1 Tax=Sphingobium phenoxybenzoativorans TaxID=1592790 RepID=UPI0008728120|nr:DUF983 domain-containing protein [Sphingobium phenoxybenzoativorans]
MPDTQPQAGAPAPTPLLIASARGLCPQCGQPTLFAATVRFSKDCRACGLSFAQFNVGDGPAAFLILIVGALVTALAVITEVKAHPPFWLHILLWAPLTIVAVMGLLRIAKGTLLILEYRNKAREGTLARPGSAS